MWGRMPPPPRIAVEYDGRKGRDVRTFKDLYAARRFYAAKYRAGKNPKVVSPDMFYVYRQGTTVSVMFHREEDARAFEQFFGK